MASLRPLNSGLARPTNQGQQISASDQQERAATPQRATTPRAFSPDRSWHSALDMPWLPRSALKKGLSVRMDNITNEILQQVRTEVSGGIQDVFPDFMTRLDARNAVSDKHFGDFSKKLDNVQEITEQTGNSAANIDFSAVTSANARMHDMAAKLMEEQHSQVKEQLYNIQLHAGSHAEAEQATLQNLSGRMQLAEGHLQRLCDCIGLHAATSDAAQDVQKMSQQLVSQQKDIDSKLDCIIASTRSLPSKEDVRAVVEQVRRTEKVVNVDFQLVLAEVSKLQKGLNMEFVQKTVFTQGNLRRTEDIDHLDAELFQPLPPSGLAPEIKGAYPAAETDDPAVTDDDDGHVRAFLDGEGDSVVGLTVMQRVREYWTQTDRAEQAHVGNQTESQYTEKKKEKPKVEKPKKPEPKPKAKPVFADAEAMKAKARMALVKEQYNVFDYYHTKGLAQQIARHPWFENVTLAVVCLNSIWMAIDTDHNNAALIQDMHPVFVCGEMAFCLYFTVEVCIRFAAFAQKQRSLKDAWFVFDAFLVSLMVFETWLLPILVFLIADLETALEGLNLSTLRLIRMVKILRLSRMAKLLRAFPELKIIVKSIRFAFRSVGVFFLLWMMIIFVTSILLTQLNSSFKTTDAFGELFARVDISMETLLLHGVLPHQASLLRTAMKASPFFWIILLAFVLLASLTIMYMLVGVLVEVMSAIAASEKEGMAVSFVATQLRATMETLNMSPDNSFSRLEFETILMEPEVVQVISGVGVDIGTLLDTMDIIFEDLNKKGISGLPFESMVDVLLNLRGANTATVKDVKELLRVLKAIFHDNFSTMQKKIQEEFYSIRSDLGALGEESYDRNDYEDDDE